MAILISSIIDHRQSISQGNNTAFAVEESIDEAKASVEDKWAGLRLTGDIEAIYIQIQYGVTSLQGAKTTISIGPYSQKTKSISCYIPYRRVDFDSLDRAMKTKTLLRDIDLVLDGITERAKKKGLVTNIEEFKLSNA
jgi:hypothetical protein